jgi:hypothetical protein
LLCDAARRAYPIRFVSYAAVLAEPERELAQVLSWLGAGDLARAVQAVKRQLRTQRRARADVPADGPAKLVRACEELYQRLCRGTALQRSFLRRVERLHQLLLPRIQAAEQAARVARRRERERVRAQRAVSSSARGLSASVPAPARSARGNKRSA